MSRIGRKPVPVPAAVKISLADSTIDVEGPQGQADVRHRREISVKIRRGRQARIVVRGGPDDEPPGTGALHGLTRSLIANNGQGRDRGLHQKLEIVGVGIKPSSRRRTRSPFRSGSPTRF